MTISVMWATALANRAKSGHAGIMLNIQILLASLLFSVSVVELAFRALDISYKDSSLMAFMADVRDQAILHGGFRRLEESPPDAADASRDINSLGYRGNGHDSEKADGTFRIACVGDSFMFGIGVGAEHSFPRSLQRELENVAGNTPVEIVNYGVPGSSLTDVSSILLTEAARSDPDMVIYGYVLNDINPVFMEEMAYYDGIGIRPAGLERMIRKHDLGGLRRHIRIYHFIISMIEDRLLNRIVLDLYSNSYDPGLNPDGMERFHSDFLIISEFCRNRGIPVVIMIYPILANLDNSYPFTATHKRVIEETLNTGMLGLDLLPFYMGKKPESLWASRTDHHPNGEGHRIAASAAADYITGNNLLSPRPPIKVVSISEEEATTNARADLDGGDPDSALVSISRALKNDPDNCELNELAAEILLARRASRAVQQKANRMRTISESCAAKADKVEARALEMDGGILIQ